MKKDYVIGYNSFKLCLNCKKVVRLIDPAKICPNCKKKGFLIKESLVLNALLVLQEKI